MPFTKKNKIKSYLSSLERKSVFDNLLQEWIDKTLKNNLAQIGLRKIEIHIDWLKDYKCIGIHSYKNDKFVEIFIYSSEFTINYSEDEADDNDLEYKLISKEDFYLNVKSIIDEI